MSYVESMEQSVDLGVQTVGGGAALGVPRTAPVSECPLCGQEDGYVLFSAPDRLHGTPGEFTYRRCADCKTVFQDPRIVCDDLHLCYPSEYLTHHSPQGSAPEPVPSRKLSSIRDRVRKSIVGAVRGQPMGGVLGTIGRVLAASRRLRERAFQNFVPDILLPSRPGQLRALEIGCGSGKLLLGLSRAGWRSEGIEVDPIAAQIARETSGRPVQVGDFRKEHLPSGYYDLIVLNHVLEHLENPISALQRVQKLLAPGGRVVVFYPNPGGLGARVYGIHWLAWDVPRHLVLPAGKELAKHARRVGLVPTTVRSTARGAEGVLALSRAQKEGRSIVVGVYQLRAKDKVLAFLEQVLVRLGFFAGEETIMAFTSSEDREAVGSLS